MSRRTVELFSLSFLDILAGALGAVLFLFIVVPKGDGKGPNAAPQLALTFDTIQQKFFGDLPDSMMYYLPGDSLLAVVIDYDEMPTIKNCPEPKPCPECPDTRQLKSYIKKLEKSLAEQSRQRPIAARTRVKPTPKAAPLAQAKAKPVKEQKVPTSKYKGDLPSVPCKFSVEVKWDDINHNVDLFLCKDGKCVYGGKRKRNEIGFWDSGKSKTSIFGGDLRSTQEAVRQFDSVIPGEYEIYLHYKGAKEEPLPSVKVHGLVYSKTLENGESGKTFVMDLPFSKKERTFIGTVSVKENGSFNFNKKI